MKHLFSRLLLIAILAIFGQFEAASQTQFLQKVLLQSGDSVAINMSEVRYATANGSGAAITYGKSPSETYYTSSSLASIVTASCGNLVSVTEYNSAGGTTVVAINPQFVKSASAVVGEAKTRLFMDGQPSRRIVSGAFDYISGLLGVCVSGGGGGAGTVTSVAITAPSDVFNVAGSPITTSGSLDLTFDSQAANRLFSGPTSGGAAAPTFRSMVTADIPDTIVTMAKIAQAGATTGQAIVWNGTAWAPDSISAGGGILTASNGLTKTGSDVALGGTLTGNTTIDGSALNRTLSVTGLSSSSGTGVFNVENTNNSGSGVGVKVATPNSTGGRALYIDAFTSASNTYGAYIEASKTALYASSGDGQYVIEAAGTGDESVGVYAHTNGDDVNSFAVWAEVEGLTGRGVYARTVGSGGIPIEAVGISASSSTIASILKVNNIRSPANNNQGTGIDYYCHTDVGSDVLQGQASYIWTNATNAVRTSAYVLKGVNSGGALGEIGRFTSATAPTLTIASAMGVAGTNTYANSGISVSSGAYTISSGVNIAGSLTLTTSANSPDAILLDPSNPVTGGVQIGNGRTITNTSSAKEALAIASETITIASGTGAHTSLAIKNTFNQSGTCTGENIGIKIAPTLTAIAANSYSAITFSPSYTASSGTGSVTGFKYTPTFNLTGSASGTQRALDINPTLTGLVSSGQWIGVDMPISNANALGFNQTGALTTNRFVGKTSHGTTSAPTALVMLAAGTATANTAPLKFTSGTNLTTAEAGAMEYDGTELYFSPSTTRYKLAQVRTGSSTIESGTYTPTRSAEANMDGNVTMTEAQYSRTGNVVTVSGRFTADPTTATGATSFQFTLPIASNIGAPEDGAGVAFSGAAAGMGASIVGVAANDTVLVSWIASDVTSQTWSYIFSYEVL